MSEITWKYVKPLKNTNAIEAFEKEHSVSFPLDLREILSKYNGGRPSLKYFDTKTEKDKEFKTLLSFNKEDIETIYKHYPLDSSDDKIVPFASDPAGNYFVIKDGKVCLWNHENDSTLCIANTFSDFLASLHE
ncbi:SMI1/KNR4 family protein [Treponema sp. UBA6852]|uniref:SMI1/KNR4 family protein n=1 Tax=Treponema sp. UBA6852 TaxID=1947744 RepID=UPI0025CF4E7F|nr:SMI1/KNR4 family protein [Treponema sp. UBA6852]